ncbi:MAG TPA: GNAT family N-acetyltransferase, partial [Chitinophagaceae bacterium]|nr:GNAT family N-acetyltransferase [Chitinophagaceae bacterium]
VARQENCKRVRWQVSDWNTPALEFYKKCGAEIDHEPCNCDFGLEQIQSFKLANQPINKSTNQQIG